MTPAEVEEVLSGSLAYTALPEAAAYLGKPGATGKLHEIFDTVMALNLENGAADTRLVATQQIDASVMAKVVEGGL